MRVPPKQVIEWGLHVLAETADRAADASVRRGPELRLILAVLYEHSDGSRAPFVDYWQACGMLTRMGAQERKSMLLRSKAIWAAYFDILAALGGPRGTDRGTPSPENSATRRRRWRALMRGDHPARTGNDTRMQKPTKSCGWL